MGKSVAQLEKELKEMSEKLEAQKVDSSLVTENEELKTKLANTREAKEESETRMMQEIQDMNDNGVSIVDGKVVGTSIRVMTPDEYREYGKTNGTIMGRKKGEVTKCSKEELRALINSYWTPSMIMEKHGMTAESLKQTLWALSQAELRDRPISLDIKRDMFGREG